MTGSLLGERRNTSGVVRMNKWGVATSTVGFIAARPMTMGPLVLAAILIVLPGLRARRVRPRAAGPADSDRSRR